MLVLFTDFGLEGPYMGQMKAVLYGQAPGVPVVDLFADAPSWDTRAAAYLLAAYADEFPSGTVFLAVVDPGVGTVEREPVVVEADGRWFVGPGNGLFSIVARRAGQSRCWNIKWRPAKLSASFHGRDLFAPVAAQLAAGNEVALDPVPCVDTGWPDDWAAVIYIDHFGNVLTGMRAATLDRRAVVQAGGHELRFAHTFGEVAMGDTFWYQNANGLMELAANQGRAADLLGLRVGDPVSVVLPPSP